MDSSPRTLLEEEPAHKVHVNLKRPVPTGKLSKQQLAEAFSSYNKKTGYLINRYWDWGFDTRWYINVDDRVAIDDLVRIYEPKAALKIKNFNLDNYTIFKKTVGPEWYPDQTAPRSAKIIGIIKGLVKIDTGGNYTFTLTSNTGAAINISDMKSDSSVKTIIDTSDTSGVANTTASIVLKGPQMANIEIYWHSPPVGTDHVLRLEYSGPDTDGDTVVANGAYWLNDKEGKPFKPLDAATIHPGFGCRFSYPKKKDRKTEVPVQVTNFRNITPDVVAQVPSLSIENHNDLVALVTNAPNLNGSGDFSGNSVPFKQVLVYCEGYVNISEGGNYVFEAKNDGGVKLTVDKVTMVDNRTFHDPTVSSPTFDPSNALSGPMTLPSGYHELRLAAILADFDPDTLPMGQSLVITYKGPDTLNGADAAVDDGNAAVPIPGYYQEDKFGDIQTVKTKSGKSRKGRYMGGGGAFEKERNPLQNFDSDWYDENKNKKWKKYDFDGDDWDKDIAGVASKIVKPWTDNTEKANAYADDGALRKIPDAIYDKPPPYDPAVVDIGGKGISWLHKEKANDLNGEAAVIGKDYVFTPWGKTINSVPEPAMDLSQPDSVEYAGGHGTPPTTFGGDKGK